MATRTLTVMANAAVQFLGALDSGAALSAQQVADALAAANDMIDNFSNEELMIIQAVKVSVNYISGTQSYALGTRAVKIGSAHSILAAGPSNEIKVLTAEEWAAIDDRQSSSYKVQYCFYDRGSATGTIYFSPIPLGGSAELELWQALAQFVDATTPLTLLPGYAEVMTLSLARILAPQYDVPITEALEKTHQEAITRLRGLNADLFKRPLKAA